MEIKTTLVSLEVFLFGVVLVRSVFYKRVFEIITYQVLFMRKALQVLFNFF